MSFLDDLEPKQTGDQHAVSAFVSKPESQGSGRNRVTAFLVTTKFANASEAMVRRTWDDFQWMQEQLVRERAGIIVPVLPDKKPPNRNAEFDAAHVAEKQAALNRFLLRVVRHPEIVDAPSLLSFFTASAADWSKAKVAKSKADASEVEASNLASVNDKGSDQENTVTISSLAEVGPIKRKGRLGQWWAAKRDERALRSKNLVLEETPVESKRFDDMHAYAEHLETCLRILAEDVKVINKSQKTISEKLKTMGASFTQLWGEHELSSTSSSNMYQTLGHCWAELSKEYSEQSQFGSQHMQIPMEELISDVAALKDALSKRKKVLYEYTKLVQEGRKMQQRMEGLRNQADMNQASDQFFALEREMRCHDAAEEERKKLKDLITDRLLRDVDRFRVEIHERVREVIEMYHKGQARMIANQSKLWVEPMPVLATLHKSKSALPTGPKEMEPTNLVVSYTTTGATASFTNGFLGHEASTPQKIQGGDGDIIPPGSMQHKSPVFDSVTVEENIPMGSVIESNIDPPNSPPPPPPASPTPDPPTSASTAIEPYIASI